MAEALARRKPGEGKLTVAEHLHDLRWCVIRALLGVGVASILAFCFTDKIFQILIIPAGEVNLIYTEMTEMVTVYMKVALTSGLIIAMPYVVYQLFVFVSKGLTPQERRAIYVILPWVGLMFIGGVAFGFFIAVPPAAKFLTTFGATVATPAIRIGSYVTTVTLLLLACGLVFQVPVVITLLARLGLVNSRQLARQRKKVLIGSFILGALLTPTMDPISQSLVAVPLIILYELGIGLARLVQPRDLTETVKEVGNV